jgi:hypothetical protein
MLYEDLSERAAALFGGFDPFFVGGGLGGGDGSLSTGHAMQHSRAEWPDNKLRKQRPIGAALQPAVENSIELLSSV